MAILRAGDSDGHGREHTLDRSAIRNAIRGMFHRAVVHSFVRIYGGPRDQKSVAAVRGEAGDV